MRIAIGGAVLVVVGELINSARRLVRDAILERDETTLLKLAKRQKDGGADYIDVNCSALGTDEEQSLIWAISLIQRCLDIQVSIDSPSIPTILRVLPLTQGEPLVNSVTADSRGLRAVLRAAKERRAKVVGLCMRENALPVNTHKIMSCAEMLLSVASEERFALADLFLDPLVRPISVHPTASRLFLQSLTQVKSLGDGVKTICGLSNVSFGMPARRSLNRALLPLAMAAGLDAVILDPTDSALMGLLYASKAMLDPGSGVSEEHVSVQSRTSNNLTLRNGCMLCRRSTGHSGRPRIRDTPYS